MGIQKSIEYITKTQPTLCNSLLVEVVYKCHEVHLCLYRDKMETVEVWGNTQCFLAKDIYKQIMQ